MHLPKKIFFTGVPGSRWSGIAQVLEERLGLNTSDRTPEREYSSDKYSGHKGVYFGTGMEFPADLSYVMSGRLSYDPSILIKSHEWSLQLDAIREKYPEAGIITVFRDSQTSFDWWHEAGGWDISYPNYDFYENDEKMFSEITKQNAAILEFCRENTPTHIGKFSCDWMAKAFGIHCEDIFAQFDQWKDCHVAYFAPLTVE